MYNYKIVAQVDGKRTESIISAQCYADAQKLFKAQFAACKVVILSTAKI